MLLMGVIQKRLQSPRTIKTHTTSKNTIPKEPTAFAEGRESPTDINDLL